MRILFVASEGLPFSKTGGLADVVEALPKALVARGHEVAVVLPRYRGTQASTVVIPSLTVPLGVRLRFPAIADGTLLNGVRYFFVDDPAYFDRDVIYGNSVRDFADNAERYSEFCRAAIEIAKHVWPTDVFHCHDWQTALLPVLLRTSYSDDPVVKDLPVVFTVHNMGYHGQFRREVLARVGIPETVFNPGALEFYGDVNFLKGGLVFSDYLTTVSRRYAEEIRTPEYGYGLDGVVRGRGDRVVGILNGVDYTSWNPAKDPFIAAKYSAKDLAGKQVCKQDLLQTFGLANDHPHRAVLGIVSRFADQKGFDLIADFDVEHGTGTGFKFAEYSGAAFLYAVKQALQHYGDERIWKRIQLNGMIKDFSWKTPAAEYAKVYQAAREVRGLGEPARNQIPVATSN